ncbi:hypothetical protein E4T42_00705 [Aureobasidium subglaciale]|nr:hypothetical protein E4T42_00705 [Aureobasidium subglaciale]
MFNITASCCSTRGIKGADRIALRNHLLKQRLYYQQNKEPSKARTRVYLRQHKEAIAARSRIYYQQNKEKIKTRRLEQRPIRVERWKVKRTEQLEESILYYVQHKEEILALREANRLETAKKRNAHYERHKEALKEVARICLEQHKEKISARRKMKYWKQKETAVAQPTLDFEQHKKEIRRLLNKKHDSDTRKRFAERQRELRAADPSLERRMSMRRWLVQCAEREAFAWKTHIPVVYPEELDKTCSACSKSRIGGFKFCKFLTACIRDAIARNFVMA